MFDSRMKKFLVVFLFIQISLFSFAQELYLMNTIQNPMQFNPGATGLIYSNRIAASRQFWIPKFEGSPVSTQVNYEQAIDGTAFGAGVLGMYDRIGYADQERLEFQLRYAFINKPKVQLAFGTALIYSTIHLAFPPHWSSFEYSVDDDPSVPYEYRNHYFEYSLGLWFKTTRLNTGISFYSDPLQWKVPKFINRIITAVMPMLHITSSIGQISSFNLKFYFFTPQIIRCYIMDLIQHF